MSDLIEARHADAILKLAMIGQTALKAGLSGNDFTNETILFFADCVGAVEHGDAGKPSLTADVAAIFNRLDPPAKDKEGEG